VDGIRAAAASKPSIIDGLPAESGAENEEYPKVTPKWVFLATGIGVDLRTKHGRTGGILIGASQTVVFLATGIGVGLRIKHGQAGRESGRHRGIPGSEWPFRATGIGVKAILRVKHGQAAKGYPMSIESFILDRTVERTGAGIPMAALRKEYMGRFGHIPRAAFLAAVAGAGYTVVAPAGRPSYLVNRTLAQPAAPGV
jgi:hypothetical protein